MFCRHKWKILSEKETESKAERIGEATGQVPAVYSTYGIDNLYGKQLIQVLTCEKCGKLKRFVTDI